MKKRIYICHPGKMDYQKELYIPLRNSRLNEKFDLIMPHEKSEEQFSSKQFFRMGCDMVVVKVGVHSTGSGIELGWADAFGVPIIAMYKTDEKIAGSVKELTKSYVIYMGKDEMIDLLEEEIEAVFAHRRKFEVYTVKSEGILKSMSLKEKAEKSVSINMERPR